MIVRHISSSGGDIKITIVPHDDWDFDVSVMWLGGGKVERKQLSQSDQEVVDRHIAQMVAASKSERDCYFAEVNR